jgi:hypothetical protein
MRRCGSSIPPVRSLHGRAPGVLVVTIVDLEGESPSAPSGTDVQVAPNPLPRRGLVTRVSRHRHLMHYNRLLIAVLAVNLVVLVQAVGAGWWSSERTNLAAIAFVAQVNLLVAVLPRQQWAINSIGRLATRPSLRWPLRVRWALGKYYHVGGVHVGAGVSGTVWYLVFVVSLLVAGVRRTNSVSPANFVVACWVLGLLVGMVVMAMPARRAKDHDRFEITHRFCAIWVLVLVWCNTVLFISDQAGDQPLWLGLVTSPAAWLLLVSTICALWPWLLLRRVPIEVERPSSHCAVVRFDAKTSPPIGTTRPISRRPLAGWHHFACVPPAPGEQGYRMLVSRAGDWTGTFVDAPPTHVWVRGLPAVGVANVKRLFTKVVFIVTGSGIGPALGHLLASETPSKLVWITRDPRQTYGAELVDEVMRANPDAVIWNSYEQGRPDVLQIAYDAYVESGAEAVICISNKAVTWQVVEGLECRGVPAFGPIWDS